MTLPSGQGTRPQFPGLSVPPDHLVATQANLSVEERVALARKEGRRGREPADTGSDPALRRHILHLIAQDAEMRVRQALAETLAQNPDAAPEVVRALASDDDLVADPLLRLSEVLSEEDLIAIIGEHASPPKMEAIAQRRAVQPAVCMALIDRGDEGISERLLRNPGAEISEVGLHRMVERFPHAPGIQAGLVDRSALPATVIERVVALLSAELRTRLIERHKLTAADAAKVALDARERATLGLTSGISDEAMAKLIEQLEIERRLTPSLLLRSLCTANIDFIVHAIAARTLSGVDFVRNRLAGGNSGHIDELWRKSGLAPSLLPLVKAALAVVAETEREGAKWDVDYLRARIAQRLVTCFDDMSAGLNDEDAEFVLRVAGDGPRTPKDFGEDAVGAPREPSPGA